MNKKREHFHQRNALLRTPHPLREHYRKLLMPTPIRSELRSLRHSRNSDVVFQEDAKNFGLFIQKRSNSERKDTKKSANRFKCLPILYNFCNITCYNSHGENQKEKKIAHLQSSNHYLLLCESSSETQLSHFDTSLFSKCFFLFLFKTLQLRRALQLGVVKKESHRD